MRTILIASPKGGCGKTTVATNLAAFYAVAGRETVLIDCDRQGSSLHWAEKRAALAHPVLGMAGRVGAKVTAKLPAGSKRCVIDSAAGIRISEVAELIEAADALVIPVLPSVIDLEASESFFAELAELPAIKRKKFPVAIVANRTKPWTNATQMAVERLKQAPFPVVAELRDSQGYVLMAGIGRSLFDYHSEQIRSHQDDWAPLLKWLKKLD
ncbi:MAG: ParA family protein [Xanthomonadales bacterium]|nr:ParA family protein [Xanthomonadales bacterium]MBK7144949.1 ParA family protein [Xanthomonadales bacterium]MCC6562032.1 ParA family protein [Xanthomonadales bacterium]